MPRGGRRSGTGGKRPGAGRKNGSGTKKTTKTTALAVEQAGEGILPLAVILFDMRKKFDAKDYDGAAERAKDAAPYLHPRLASRQVNVDVSIESSTVVELLVTTREQADAVLANLSNSSGVPRQ